MNSVLDQTATVKPLHAREQYDDCAATIPQTCHPADPDLDLLRSWKAGDERAFEELVRKNKKHAYYTALRITRNVEDAEDAVQESFLKVYRKFSLFEGRSFFSAWLTRIVVNSSLGILRRKGHRVEPVSLDNPEYPVELPDPGAGPEELCYCAEFMALLEGCISDMKANYGPLLVLQIWGDKSLKQSASALGITASAAKTRCFRARSILKRAIQERMDNNASKSISQ